MPLSRSAGTATASALLVATLALTLVSSAIAKPKTPLTLDVSAHPAHTVSYDWSLTKTAMPGGMINTTDSETDVTYEVAASRDGGTTSEWTVDGKIDVHNAAKHALTDALATVTADGAVCTVGGGGVIGHLPAGTASELTYTCTYGSEGPGATPKVDVEVAGKGGYKALKTVYVSFVAPEKTINGAVNLTDAFDGAAPRPLGGGERLTESKTFIYTRTLPTPKTGCRVYRNTAHLESVPSKKKGEKGGESETASAEVTVCRPTTPAPVVRTKEVTPPTRVAPAAPRPRAKRTPRTRLRITKRGPRRVVAGSLVRYRITVSARTKVAARRVVVRDILPAGMVLARRVPGVRVKGRQLIWTSRGLTRKRSISKIVTLRVLKSTRGTRCNRADAIARNASRVRTRSCTKVVRPKPKTVSPAVLG